MQPVISRCSVFNDPEPPDVFCGLGSLIVEGRVPVKDDRGFGEGPHVPFPRGPANGRHACTGDNAACKRDENFRKHLLLLWQNNVPIRIEVLLCSTCRISDKPVEFTFIPEPGAILLEQWTVSMRSKSLPEPPMTGRGLFQAVRSYLHFSQLSAWYASTKGHEPSNVHYRITIPGERFSSKFNTTPVEHRFPPATVGESLVDVTVLSLPRSEDIPRTLWCHETQNPIASERSQQANFDPFCSPDGEDFKLTVAGSLCLKDSDHPETDLRRAIVKTRLSECSGLDRSDSMDSILGDSLLDPPQSLQKIPPRRYQSPSRCGSPCLEAPDHLLFGLTSSRLRESSNDSTLCGSSRRARQDLLRRRDMTMQVAGPHPKASDGASKPWTNVKVHKGHCEPEASSRNCNVTLQDERESENSSDDCAFVKCCQSETGKRSCRPCHGLDLGCDKNSKMRDQAMLGAKSKQRRNVVSEVDDEGEEVLEYPTDHHNNNSPLDKAELQKLMSFLSPSEPTTNMFEGSKLKVAMSSPFQPSDLNEKSFFTMENKVTQIYRAETLFDQPSVLESRIKDFVSSPFNYIGGREGCEQMPQMQLNQSKCGENISKFMQEKLRVEEEFEKERLGNLSPDTTIDSGYSMEPLDLSFDDDGQSLQYEILDSSLTHLRHDCKLNPVHNIPSTDAVNTFLKSFDSATSMVFHGRRGLPLTSSPAPLRRGLGKFDYDSAIASPHDIKKALFQSQYVEGNYKKEIEKDERKRRPSQKLLSASAPATIASSNLLCNFEESVLNGRLEPVSTVEGFFAEIGASGSFHPKHLEVPVTVFFYTLCDNATLSSPYLGHINLGKKGYRVPQKGTIQVTLFNPMGTVVKMFVVMYDLSDMPANSQTFLRQRTLYMPSDLSEANSIDAKKWLRYLIHLRFASSKSGKLYLHTDIRMIIFRKSDLDTATDHNNGKGYELRSFTKGPTNPKFSPRR